MSKTRDDIFLKIERANKHIADLHVVLRAFIDSNPYGVSMKRDPQTQEIVYYVAKADDPPDDIPVIAGDVIQNLRTALDYLACELVKANGKSPTKNTCFPISDEIPTTKDQQASFDRKVEGMGKEAIDIIRAAKPYKGGNQALWRLHALNNREKHRLLFTVAMGSLTFNAGQHVTAARGAQGLPPDMWVQIVRGDGSLCAMEKDMVLVRDPPNSKVNDNIQLTGQIVLNEPGICEGEPLILVLRHSWATIFRLAQQFVKCLMR